MKYSCFKGTVWRPEACQLPGNVSLPRVFCFTRKQIAVVVVCTDKNIKCPRGSRLKFHFGVIVISIYGPLDTAQLERGMLKIHWWWEKAAPMHWDKHTEIDIYGIRILCPFKSFFLWLTHLVRTPSAWPLASWSNPLLPVVFWGRLSWSVRMLSGHAVLTQWYLKQHTHIASNISLRPWCEDTCEGLGIH